ncbi:MAG TPA: ornithine carbamoyltransferase [Anaerolineae bacterium]|nr:ornithine carbamoyltransferase [Anaerolineae bacterium]
MDLSLPRRASLKGRDFITLGDYDQEDLYFLLDTAEELKRAQARGVPHRVLEGKSLGMLFGKPSTRTRISFETAMTQLGGHAQFYAVGDLQLAHKETWVDTARAMDRYLDGIAIRLYNVEPYGESRRVLNTIADAAHIPVINMLDDGEHPCQVLSDVLTMREKLRTFENKKIVMSWAYSPRAKSSGVPQGWVLAAAILGIDLTLAYPEGFDLDPDYMEKARRFADKSDARIEIVHDMKEAARDAHIYYAKSWRSFSLTPEQVKERDEELQQWIVTDELLDLGDKCVKFMHCLPADRNLEVTDAVIDGERSIVYDQLENRLHTQKAILALLL